MRKVALLGVGSMRAAPAAVASLAWLDEPWEVTLFDPNEERLDLVDRFARTAFDELGVGHRVSVETELEQACEQADAALCCLGYDGALRLLGLTRAPATAWAEDPQDALRYGRGDINRTSDPEAMSPHLVGIISEAVAQIGRDEAIERAMDRLSVASEGARRLSLVRGWSGPGWDLASWPEAIGQDERVATAHRLLRLVRDDDDLRAYLMPYRVTPVGRWMSGR